MMKTFLATNGSGIARVTCVRDGHWSVDQVLEGNRVTCLASDPLNPGQVYAGTRTSGVLFSADQGQSWQPLGLAGQVITAIAISPLISGRIVASTKPSCIFLSSDYGVHWEELTSFRSIFSCRFDSSPAEKPYTAYVQGIALSPSDPKVILVGIEAGAVVRSTDGGNTWQGHRRGALRDCHSITFHTSNGNWVYEAGGTGAGTAISRDGGNLWIQHRRGLDRNYGWACAADPIHPEVSYLSASPSPSKAHSENNAQAYIFRSDSEGVWKKLEGGLPQPLNYMPYALLTDPHESGNVYAGLSNGDVWFSLDYGEMWEQLPFNLKSIHRSMVMLS